jgi:hypothetical protein
VRIADRPYEDAAALALIRRLDPVDRAEIGVPEGRWLEDHRIWFDWRCLQPHAVASVIVAAGRGEALEDIALVALVRGALPGLGHAAMIAADHRRHRRGLALAAAEMRRRLPVVARRAGLTRIECRVWEKHPTGPALLAAVGLRFEARCPGFGPGGCAAFLQYAWTDEGRAH